MTTMPSRVLVDTNFLIAWGNESSESAHGQPIGNFVSLLTNGGSRLVLPTPVIAEYLVRCELSAVAAMNALIDEQWVGVGSFDYRAAIRLHAIDRCGAYAGDKKDGIVVPWQKLKIDRQIVAIAQAMHCDFIISSDRGVAATALRLGIRTCSVEDIGTIASRWRCGFTVREPKHDYPTLPNSPINHSRKIAVSS